MTSFGGAYFGDHENLFGPIGDRPITVNEEPVHDTIRMMRSFMEGPDAESTLTRTSRRFRRQICSRSPRSRPREPFTSGNAIFHRNWPYAIPLNLDSEEFSAEDYDVMPLPYGIEAGEGEYEGTGGTGGAARRRSAAGTSRSTRTPRGSTTAFRCSRRSPTRR